MARTGFTCNLLQNMVREGSLRGQGEDRNGDPLWFHEEDITRIARAQQETQLQAKPKPYRKQSDSQLEAMHTRQWKREAKSRRYRGNAQSSHMERVMFMNKEPSDKV